MRLGDSAHLAVVKLRQRWGRTMFAVLAFAAALVPPILILDLIDGGEAVIRGRSELGVLSPRSITVRKGLREGQKLVPAPLTQADREFLQSLPGVVKVQDRLYAHSAYMLLDDGTAVTRFMGADDEVVNGYLAPGQDFRPTPQEIPVLLARLDLLYSYKDGKMQRVDRDLQSLVGRRFDLHLGDIYQNIHIAAIEKGHGEAEIRSRKARRKRYLNVDYDVEKIDRKLTFKVRVAGIAPGFVNVLPYDTCARFKRWLSERGRNARRETLNKRLGYHWPYVTLRFDTVENAKANGDLLLDKDYEVRSPYVEVRKTLDKVKYAIYIVGGIALFVLILACFLISSIIARVILDAKQEIGVLRALGARQGHVLRIYLLEALAICFLGGILGMLAGNAGALAISSWVLDLARGQSTDFSFLGRHVRLYEIDLLPESLYRFAPGQLAWVAVAILLALAAAAVPAWRSARVDPTEALRSF